MIKVFKKQLAVLLAVMVVLCSISVVLVTSAAHEDVFSTSTKFYKVETVDQNEVLTPATSGTLKVNKGDKVRAKVYVTTNFVAHDVAVFMAYNKSILALDTSKLSGFGSSSVSIPVFTEGTLTGTYVGKIEDGSDYHNKLKAGNDTFFTDAYFSNINTLYISVIEGICQQYDGNALLCTLDFTVNSSATVDDEGLLFLVPNSQTTPDDEMVTAINKVAQGDETTALGLSTGEYNDYVVPDAYDLKIDSNSEKVVLNTNKVIFDANGGKITVNTEQKDKVEKKGLVGDNVSAPASSDMSREGYNFVNWKLKDSSTTKAGGASIAVGSSDVTYEAQWDAKTIKINVVDSKNGNSSKNGTYGSTVADAGVVDSTKDLFAGWDYAKPSGTGHADDVSKLPVINSTNYSISNDEITITAVYKEQVTYTFTATSADVPNGTVNGKASDTIKLNKNESNTYTVPSASSNIDGVTFDGWALSTDTSTVVLKAGSDNVTPTADVTYVAHYNDSRVTITYSYTKPGESKATEIKEKLVSGKDLTAPTVDDVVGYTFSWKNLPGDGKVPTSSTTINGEFTKKQYTVIWYDDDDNTVKDTSAAFEFGSNFTENAPDMSTVESFDSWEKTITKFDANTVSSATDVYTKNGKVVASTEPGATKTENVILIKPIHKNQITVTYKDNGVTVTNGEVKGYAGRQINNIPDVPEVDGYESAWDPALTIFPTSDTTVNAKHTAKSVSVTFTDWSTSNTNKKYDEKLTDPNVSEINNKKVNGWFFKKNETTDVKFDFSKTIEQNMKDAGCNYSETLTLTAAYTVIDKYLIIDTYDFTNKKVNEYKDGGADYTVENKPGTAYYAPTAEAEEGFILTGWSTTPNGAKTIELGASMQLGDAHNTYYGVYERKQYTVDFYDGDNKYFDTQTITYGEPFARPEDPIVAEGEDPFVGWLENGTKDTFVEAYKNAAGQYIMPNKNLRFDAKYKSQWDVDSGLLIGGLVVGGAVVGGIVAVNTALITGAAVVGGTVAIIGGVHLYKHTYTVTYMVDGEVYRTFKVVNGLKVPTPKDPSKDGATFKGWDKDIPSTMPEHDLVFEAQFGNGTGIPATGSASIGIVAFAALSVATATAFVFKKKKEDEE